MGIQSDIDRRQSEQREAWRSGKMIYVAGRHGTYHMPGQTKPDGTIRSLCGRATGKIGAYNVLTALGKRDLCGTCGHLSGTPVLHSTMRLPKSERRYYQPAV